MTNATLPIVALAIVAVVAPRPAQASWLSALGKGVATAAHKTGSAAGRGIARGGAAAAKGAAIASRKVLDKLGVQGAQAMTKLSSRGAQQLSDIAGRLAKSPHKQAWLKTIAQRGDDAVAWLWKRKSSIAVGAGATAVVLAPEEFIAATERLSAKAMEVAGEHIARPMATAIAAPMGSHVAQHAQGFAGLLLRLGLIGGGLGYVYYRVRLRPARKSEA
ncbi:hypothetical protein KOR34_01030 [Posidoniimonas corsicana]|uniref:Uncharacterized protein n=1 Tax=Posidoniimonas corsicana TaxID=1938618 RepID=A0A5C5VC54_9BACT|nr:hypothetical protein [Posidoniimonas corsicana]TWT35215.1 hypothetical protein KOR34_01030 [Posidoniimonas corsicana]